MKFSILIFSISIFTNPCFTQILFKPTLTLESPKLKKIIQENNRKKALTYIDSLLNYDSTIGEYYYTRAVINYYLSPKSHTNSTSIVRDLHKAIDKNFDNPEINYLLFSQYCNCDGKKGIGNLVYDEIVYGFSEAKQQINLALEKKPMEEKYLIAKTNYFREISLPSINSLDAEDYYSYEVSLENLISISQDKKVIALSHYQLANIYLKYSKDTARGLSYLTNAITIDSTEIGYFTWRAYIKRELNDYNGAISDFSLALKRKKEATFFLERANCYFELNKAQLAISDYTNAIQLFEKKRVELLQKKLYTGLINEYLTKSHRGRAYSYISLNDSIKACADYSKALDYGLYGSDEILKKYCK